MASNFVHLHTHSHYSLLDGVIKIKDLVAEAKKQDAKAIAITDHGAMYGVIEFYKKCKAAEIKPIIGVEVYVAFESMTQKRANIDNKRFHLVLLAENNTGYKNLLKIVTASYLDGFYYKPRVDKEFLAAHHEGIIAMSACMAGELPRLMGQKKIKECEEAALQYQKIFGKDNFFIEVMHHPNLENHEEIQRGLVDVARRLNIPIVATQDTHYLKPEDAQAQDMMIAIQNNDKLDDTKRLSMVGEDFSMRPPKLMADLFKQWPDAIENTSKIADRCNVEIELGKWVFPKMEIPDNKTPEVYLRELAAAGLEKKFGVNSPQKEENGFSYDDMKKRMEFELDIICTKGYAPYFLVVGDMIAFARSKGIVTTTRGSAAGSFVSYLINITSVDPVKYFLPFERFLNPFRPSPPDIDMDFADNRREEMIEYVKEKYGHDKVAQIGTFGTMMARGAVRDITRALGKPYSLGDQVSKMIPMGSQGFPMTINQAMKMTPELQKLYDDNSEVKEILDLARKIEGCARHISVHAAGTVIAPEPLVNFVPLQREPNGEKIITQYNMHAVEDVGLLKMDFLGITNLSILGNAVKLVKKIHGIDIDPEKVPLDDKKVFKMLAAGDTVGVFQLGGNGMRRYLKELKPTTVTDLMAMIALFRPGPMVSIPSFIKRKHGEEKITYLHPKLEKILEKTYGIVTYQDDVLFIAIELAGYDLNTVDKFRKAIGKKIPEEMAKQEVIFKEGCQKHSGLSKKQAEEMWALFEPFKGYGFNKAHAASYGMISYQTAYMKAHYPVEYMTAILTADAGDNDKIAITIAECKQMKIPVLPPDINESYKDFSVAGESIRFGLYTIKNLGEEISNIIIEERKAKGPYKSYSDFLTRIQHRNMNKKSLEALIKAGAMERFGERGQLLANLEAALEYNKEVGKGNQNQQSLFSMMPAAASAPISDLRLKEAPPALPQDKLMWEKELLGLYISGHPLDKFADKMEKIKVKIGGAKTLADNMPIVTIGMIENAKKILTKKNDTMYFLKLSDYTDSIEVVVFPRAAAQYEKLLFEGNCIAIKGKMSLRNGDPSIIVDEMKGLA